MKATTPLAGAPQRRAVNGHRNSTQHSSHKQSHSDGAAVSAHVSRSAPCSAPPRAQGRVCAFVHAGSTRSSPAARRRGHDDSRVGSQAAAEPDVTARPGAQSVRERSTPTARQRRGPRRRPEHHSSTQRSPDAVIPPDAVTQLKDEQLVAGRFLACCLQGLGCPSPGAPASKNLSAEPPFDAVARADHCAARL